MFQQSQTRLNRMTELGYYLNTLVGARTYVRVDHPDASNWRDGMDVTGVGAVHGSHPVRPTGPAAPSVPANGASASSAGSPISSPKDELEISAAGNKMLERLNETPQARAERLAEIKQAIDNGDYDTDAKLEAALERMFEMHGFDLGDE